MKKILIVDDEPHIRIMLEQTLEDLEENDVELLTAKDGQEGLEIALKEEPSLIFLDVMMPGEDGFSVCTTLKKDPLHADIPVILLSARGQDSDRDRGLSVGALDFFTKPYSPSDLVRRVREVLFDSGDNDAPDP